jgi:hypothetical protein
LLTLMAMTQTVSTQDQLCLKYEAMSQNTLF